MQQTSVAAQSKIAPMKQTAGSAKAKIFFPNLDGLRFVSFFVVFLYHSLLSILSYLKDSSPRIFTVLEFLFRHGNLGVNFFFVLSGFLITYLLIKEKEFNGRIHVPNFYVRRILRIWPLYYLCVVVGFIGFGILKKMSGQPLLENANPWYYIFFGANFDIMHTWPEKPDALLLSVLWSVAVEEQFYLTWPLILSIVPFKKIRYVFPAIMAFSLIFRSLHTGVDDHDFAIRYFHTFSVIGDMALGGLFAYLVSYENKFKTFITNMSRPAIIMIYLLTLVFTLFKDDIFQTGIAVVFERLVIAFLFGMIILEQNYSKNSFYKMSKYRTLSNMGIFTYGLYCLHFLGLYFAIKVMNLLHLDGSLNGVAFSMIMLALLLSIGISLMSYHFYEKWFLKLKDKFAFIVKK
ncbi:MAG TPA: acyltransferase [Flavitalea sp.]|nr:acyltransferase [Flavitalea sp.]